MEIPTLNQSPVTFRSSDHTYWLVEKQLQGITSTLVRRAYPDTYKCPEGYTEEQWQEVLANAAAKGSNMHETIELYDEIGATSDLPELMSYIKIKQENDLTVLATEYLVSDEERYATAIDKVMMTPDGGIILVDLKHTSSLHIENVTLQLSICKRWFEKLNPGLNVKDIYAMWLRDDKSRFVRLTPWADELIDALIDADTNGYPFDITMTYGELPQRVYDVQEYLRWLDNDVKTKTEELKTIKERLCAMMLDRGIKKFTTDVLQMTTVTPKPKKTFDSKTFAAEHPDLYEQYVYESDVKPSIKITFK